MKGRDILIFAYIICSIVIIMAGSVVMSLTYQVKTRDRMDKEVFLEEKGLFVQAETQRKKEESIIFSNALETKEQLKTLETIKSNFSEEYQETPIQDIINFEKTIPRTFTRVRLTVKERKSMSYNDLSVSREIIKTGEMTEIQLKNLDHVENMTQNEINTLLELKLDKLRTIPVRKENANEKFFQASIDNLMNSYYKDIEFTQPADKIPDVCGGRIDVLWTYVNGSDAIWLSMLKESSKKFDPRRYREYDSLKYSMRSVYQNLKFAKHWFVLLSSIAQIPTFLNLTKIKQIRQNNTITMTLDNVNGFEGSDVQIHFVFHDQIFPQISFLPTFNSNGIESSFAFIPGLSECFVYMNDDFFINRPLSPNFFIQNDGKLNLYKSSLVAPSAVNTGEWHNSITTSNGLLDSIFGYRRRNYITHNCYFFRKSILQELNDKFKINHSLSRFHKLRNRGDIAIPFLHSSIAEEEHKGTVYYQNRGWFKLFSMKTRKDIDPMFNEISGDETLKCYCINDDLGKNIHPDDPLFDQFKEGMAKLYPNKTPFENDN